jgi:hypothetical protein
MAGVPFQCNNDNILPPVTYFSRKHFPAVINNEIYDKELLAIVHAFKDWCPPLDAFPHTIQMFSDHQNLTYITTNYLLNYRQTYWSEPLSLFDCKIDSRPAKAHDNANAVTCQ